MSLGEYRRRRDPSRSPEPVGGVGRRPGTRFVVQRHAARRLHYDLRLERDGVLVSWAVPKGVPLRPGERHLAVHVEDHPLDYISFEGEIPAGQYGAGTVEIWDSGTYETLERKRDGGLTVRLHGSRLRGVWALVPAHLDGDERNWLLLRKEAEAFAGGDYRPQLATSATALPAGSGWSFEPKWDGYRAIAVVRGGEARLTSRNGNDLTSRFAGLARSVARAVRSPELVVDGEVCALNERGEASFGLLQQGGGTLVYVVFDLLEDDGRPCGALPLRERRLLLARSLDPSVADVIVSPVFDDGDALLAAVGERGLEGVVAKRVDAPYRPGKRSPDWIKVKVSGRDDLPIVGYTLGQGRRSRLGSLVLGRPTPAGLRWAGNVGTGLSEAEIGRLLGLLEPLRTDASPLAERPRMPRVRSADVRWVEPRLRAEVSFAEWTREGRLRAPVYLGLREDDEVPPSEQMPTEIRRGRRVLRLTNLDKPFWPVEGITKGDLLSYYRAIAPVLVPHLHDRPFTMKRFPDGWEGKSFFQKQAPSHVPDWIHTARFPASTRDGERRLIDYVLANDELALLWLVNMGCIEMHAWASRRDRADRPDWVMFDLDPSEGATFDDVVSVALILREVLELVELESFPKTSGSRGIHVLVPIARRHDWADVRRFAEIVAAAMERAHPGLVTTEWVKAKRTGVLVDANQNGPGRTTASVYSVRPRAGAPVSTPLAWPELVPGLDPTSFTMSRVLERVASEGDLYASVLRLRQSLTSALRAVS